MSRGRNLWQAALERLQQRGGRERPLETAESADLAVLKQWYSDYRADDGTLEYVIFSKDRPLQLHALVMSLRASCRSNYTISVVYATSNERFVRAYDELFGLFSKAALPVQLHPEGQTGGFKSTLCAVLHRPVTSRVCFLVDDIVFLREFQLEAFSTLDLRDYVPSLRLGRGITYSYMVKEAETLPESLVTEDGRLVWSWKGNSIDWSYPMSVDGNIFLRTEIAVLADRLSFHSPNTFESALVSAERLFNGRKGICFEAPVLVNIPSNLVQSDFSNAHGEWTSEQLLDIWNQGLELDWKAYWGQSYPSVHMELPYTFQPRRSS